MTKYNHDDIYNKAISFFENKKSKNHNQGFSNIYVIQKTDIDGNVTGEYFGMNMVTDYGMGQYFDQYSQFPRTVYIGNGTGHFDSSMNSLLSAITTTGSTNMNMPISCSYPLYYDKTSGLITCMCRYATVYFDYHLDGITEPIIITEYGLGTAYNALWTHSWVYDSNGNRTNITKKDGERLTLTVFLCFCYHESLIVNGWKEGVYMVISNFSPFVNVSNRMYGVDIKTYNLDGTFSKDNNIRISSGFHNNESILHSRLPEILITKNNLKYIDGFSQYDSGMIILEPQHLETPEEFETVLNFSSVSTDNGLNRQFGKHADSPFTQADISSVCLCNFKTGEWDIEEDFINDPNHWYSNETTRFLTKIYYTDDEGIIREMNVRQNVMIDDPIVKIEGNSKKVYATNKYWDTSTWINIPDLNNIPEDLKKCRFWITDNGTINTEKFIRQSREFILVPEQGGVVRTGSYLPNLSINQSYIDAYEYGFFFNNERLYKVNEEDNNLNIQYIDNIPGYSKIWGNYIVSCCNNREWSEGDESGPTDFVCYIHDMSNIQEGKPSTEKILLARIEELTGSIIKDFSNYFTETGTGLFVCQLDRIDKCIVIDMRCKKFYFYTDTYMSTCIYGTNMIARYLPSENHILIENYSSNGSFEVLGTITPPNSMNVSFMLGWNNYLYITDGYSKTLSFNINNLGEYHNNEIVIPYIKSHNSGQPVRDINISCVDDALIFHKLYAEGLNEVYYIKKEDPSNIRNLSTLDDFRINERVYCGLRYVCDNTNLILFVNTPSKSTSNRYNSIVYDFGWFLRIGEKVINRYCENVCLTPFGKSFIYYDYINGISKIPMEYFLPHKVIGTTKTISSINNDKCISGKETIVTITNVQKFVGLPPGDIQ